jgi:hypothetical protein
MFEFKCWNVSFAFGFFHCCVSASVWEFEFRLIFCRADFGDAGGAFNDGRSTAGGSESGQKPLCARLSRLQTGRQVIIFWGHFQPCLFFAAL